MLVKQNGLHVEVIPDAPCLIYAAQATSGQLGACTSCKSYATTRSGCSTVGWANRTVTERTSGPTPTCAVRLWPPTRKDSYFVSRIDEVRPKSLFCLVAVFPDLEAAQRCEMVLTAATGANWQAGGCSWHARGHVVKDATFHLALVVQILKNTRRAFQLKVLAAEALGGGPVQSLVSA